MSQVSHLKSAQITALDTVTPSLADVQNAGAGAPSRCVTITGYVTPVAADSVNTTYQFVRVPSTAIIKYVGVSSQAQAAGAIDIGVYYSDSTIDGTAAANQGLVVPTTGKTFFASQQSLATALNQTDVTFSNQATSGANNPSLINTRLWQALGLATDPGGFFDIVGTVDNTAITTGGGFTGLQVDYAE